LLLKENSRMAEDNRNINFVQADGVAEIVLNNPPVNIMTQAMMQEINAVLEKLTGDPGVHVLIFKAEGKHFSAGADVGEHTKEKCQEMIPEFMKLFYNLNKITCPVIAVVQGMALGGGCELVMFCDMVVASEKAKFGQPEIAVGVFPPVAVAVLPHLTGRNRAMELLLSGNIIAAAEAEKIGLINKVFPVEDFEEETAEFVSGFTSKSPAVLRITKKIINRGLYDSVLSAMMAAEENYLHDLMDTEDANEGIRAFLEKRNPVWKGR